MMNLTIPLDDKLFKAVAATAEELGMPVTTFAVRALRVATSPGATPSPGLILDDGVPALRVYAPYLAAALRRIKSLDDGTVFTLSANHRDSTRLFSPEEWTQMKAQPGFSPTVFGKEFLKFITKCNRHSRLVTVLDKTSDHKQLYAKVGPAEPAESAAA